MIVPRAGGLVLAMFLLVSRVLAQAGEPLPAANQPALTVKPLQAWSGVFGGEKLELAFQVSGRNVFKGTAGWSVAVADRIIARGEVAVAVEPDKPATVRPDFRLPPVKDGVVIQGRVSVSVYGADGKPPDASCEKDIWIFSTDPFAGRQQWLKGLQIQLFDPEKKTAAVFDKAKVPYTPIGNVAALSEVKDGMVIIGEGVSFKDYRALPDLMVRAAGNGARVLCLVPAEGTLALPGAEGSALPAPKSISLRQNDIIGELDKRLDSAAWPPDGKLVASALTIRAEQRRVIAEPSGERGQWPWLELRFERAGAPGGRLVVCGFAVIRKWNSGPTPRFLFARVLEHLGE